MLPAFYAKFLNLSIDNDDGRILKLVGGKSSLAHLTTQPWLKDLCDFPPVAAVYSILLFAFNSIDITHFTFSSLKVSYQSLNRAHSGLKGSKYLCNFRDNTQKW